MTIRSEMARLGSGDVGLSVILAIQISIVFIVAPLAATDSVTVQLAEMLRFGLAATMILIVAHNWIMRAAIAFAFIATLLASLHWQLGGTADAIVLGKYIVTILFDVIVAAVVAYATFAPGKVTIHRILGAVILYLYVALIFAGIYRALAVTLHPAFHGLPAGQRGQFAESLLQSERAHHGGERRHRRATPLDPQPVEPGSGDRPTLPRHFAGAAGNAACGGPTEC